MPEIRELSKSTINKIAAGEVVERPANVVKELIENSIDAGASRIDVFVERSGSDSIKVVDDGCGVARDQLVLALSPHATSKISGADDLFDIRTFGFRGEALASIAEISRLTLRSRTADSPEGASIRSVGGVFDEIAPCGCAVGTSIEARDLFFNVPARRKFLKSPTTEFAHISEAVVRVALPNPGVRFLLKHNARTIYDLPPTTDPRERIGRIFGADLASRLVPIESECGNVKVVGFAGLPDLARATQAMQYLFLNGRYVRDRALQHALAEAYRGLIVSGRYPVAFLNIETPPDFVDVNVHPTKLEVRFVDGQAIYSAALSAIRERLQRADLTSRPNDAELEAAARRSDARFDRGGDRRFDAAPLPERRFVPDVDPRDPGAALDASVAAASRAKFFGWLDRSAKSTTDARPGESTSAAGSAAGFGSASGSASAVRSDFDLDAANAALDEAALDEAASLERESTNRSFGGGFGIRDASGFRKFPPLSSTRRPFPTRDADSPNADSNAGSSASAGAASDADGAPTFAPGSFGGRFDAATELAPNASSASNAPNAPNVPSTAAAPERPAELFPVSGADDESNAETDGGTNGVGTNGVGTNGAFRVPSAFSGANSVAFGPTGKPVIRICDRYLATEARGGLAIIDQHALHERILFERLKANLEAGSLDVQRLLVPETVELAPTELAFALENRENFAELGILIDGLGGATLAINGLPAILRDASATDVFLAALGSLQGSRGKVERADLLDATLKQMACKAAVKAADALRPDAIAELLASAEEEIAAHHCPHGRPSTLVLSRRELDKLFKRIV